MVKSEVLLVWSSEGRASVLGWGNRVLWRPCARDWAAAATTVMSLSCLLQYEVKRKSFQWKNRQPHHYLSSLYNLGITWWALGWWSKAG